MKFSVAMCTYNGVRYLEEQLQSIAAQTRPPDELVVCDDCSTDLTPRLVREFAAHSSLNVRLHRNERNLGSTGNFGRAIELCRGDLIALADQDDIWQPTKLACMEQVFKANPRLGLIFTDAELVDENSALIGRRLWQRLGLDAAQQQEIRAGQAFEMLLKRFLVTGATCAFRSEFKRLILPMHVNPGLIHDAWCALLIAAVADLEIIAEPLIHYRQHPQQQLGIPPIIEKRRARRAWDELRDLYRRKAPRRQTRSDNARKQSKANASSSSGVADVRLSLEVLEIVDHRLKTFAGDALRPDVRRALDDNLRHARARAALPSKRWRRFPVIYRELCAGRYHRFSNGLYSVARDLLA